MNKLVSILTATAAGLVVVGAANAADLPSKKAAPAQYVKICDAFGAGFFYIPGSTDTCLKVGGRVRAEYRLHGNASAASDLTVFRARFYMNLDARTKTSYGDLRTFIQYRVTTDTKQSPDAAFVTDAWINFAGITAGRKQSFFDFYAHDNDMFAVSYGSDATTNLLAYTASFGSGFSATLSLEDPIWRATNGTPGNATGVYGTPANIGYTGNGVRSPDVVGNLKVDQAWGSAMLSGAMHQVNAVLANTTNTTKVGYAVQGGVKVLLPMLAKGDFVLAQATYASGATEYVNSNNTGAVWRKFAGVQSNVGLGYQTAVPTTVAAPGDSLGLVKTWAVTGAFMHYWTPQLRNFFYASYANEKMPSALQSGQKFWGGREMILGTNLVWSPVAGLDIGPEVIYENVKLNNGNFALANAPKASDWRATFRFQRTF